MRKPGSSFAIEGAVASNSANLTISGVETRAKLAEQYNSLLIQITQLAKDSSFNGVNLISMLDSMLGLSSAANTVRTVGPKDFY